VRRSNRTIAPDQSATSNESDSRDSRGNDLPTFSPIYAHHVGYRNSSTIELYRTTIWLYILRVIWRKIHLETEYLFAHRVYVSVKCPDCEPSGSVNPDRDNFHAPTPTRSCDVVIFNFNGNVSDIGNFGSDLGTQVAIYGTTGYNGIRPLGFRLITSWQ